MSDQNAKSTPPAGMQENVALLIAYLFSIVGGLIILLAVAGDNKKLKFHALQSIGLGIVYIAIMIVLTILAFIPFVGILSMLVGLAFFAACIYLAVMAYQGKTFDFPVIADIVRPMSEK